MAEKKQESFTVTDRRLFTAEGDIREEVPQQEVSTAAAAPKPEAPQNVCSTSNGSRRPARAHRC